MKEEENKYKDLISDLKSLPKVKTKSDFEQRLYRKLRNAEPENKYSPAFKKLTNPKESNWIFNIFKPAFIPAIGVSIALLAVIVIYINFIPKDDELTQTEQTPVTYEEMVIKDPGDIEKSTLDTKGEDSESISQDITGGIISNESSITPFEPNSDADIAPLPSIIQPGLLDEMPVMEQKMERKEADDKIIEKNGRFEKKGEDLKKVEKKESLKTNKSDEETNLKKNIGDELFETGIKPSMGLEKNRTKDSLKIDSIKSKKSKVEGNENGQVDQKTETEKQAEPIKQEPNKEDK